MMRSCWYPFYSNLTDFLALQPARQVGIKNGRRTVWKKETRDRIKVLKMELGDSRPIRSKPCSSEPDHFYLVSWHTESICCAMIESASCVPGHVSDFIDYFGLSLLFSCTKGITQLEAINLHMLLENILVCAQEAFWTCADLAFQGPHYVFP